MSSFDLVINGKTVKANRGETLVDAGLSGWVAIRTTAVRGNARPAG